MDPKIHLMDDLPRQRTLVYVEVGRDEDGRRLFQDQAGNLTPVADGAEPPLYMWIPDHIARALGEALAPRPAATERHLDDAMDVRDRMIALVERVVVPPAMIELDPCGGAA